MANQFSKQQALADVAMRAKRAVLEIEEIFRVGVDYGDDPESLRFWNIQSSLLEGLEDLCRSVRVDLRIYRDNENAQREPALKALELSKRCDEAMNRARGPSPRELLEQQGREEAEAKRRREENPESES